MKNSCEGPRVADAAHVAADAKNVHREEGQVEEDVRENEMDLAARQDPFHSHVHLLQPDLLPDAHSWRRRPHAPHPPPAAPRSCSSSTTSSRASRKAGARSAIRGSPTRSNGAPPRRRRTAITRPRRSFIAARTSTARPRFPRTGCRRTAK